MNRNLLICVLLVLGSNGYSAIRASSQATKKLKITAYTTSRNTNHRLTPTPVGNFKEVKQLVERDTFVFVNSQNEFQTFIGFGGALTDAAAETFAKLPATKQAEFLTAYYSRDKGIGYTMARTNINSCDFSSNTYTYVADGDSMLRSFDIAPDKRFKIPFIRKAIEAAGGNLNLFVSPWSPPAWMKDNNNMLQGGKLLEKYKQTWANYFVKFIKSYQALGIPVWGLTVQNEPMARQRWESCIFTATDERDFIKNHLGPTLHANGLADKKIIAWDHNRDLMFQRAATLLNDPEAAKYIWGIGFHWYETWTGGGMQFENIKKVTEAFPATNLIFTEGCIEKFNPDRLTDWALGEKYGMSIINDLNNGTVAWTDWNVLLDETGGPNHVGNFCFAPIHADTKTGELIYTNIYYYLGQFSKFIQPGAKRIGCTANRDKLLTTAFKNPNGELVVVVMNSSDSTMNYHLWVNNSASLIQSEAHSIATFIIN